MKVVKRNGIVEDFNKEKVLEAINYCCEGLDGVEAKAVYMNARIRLFDGISTAEIHDTVIHSARDMITDLQPNYALVAGRLELMKIRKDAFNSYTPPNLLDHISKMCDIGVYHKEIIEKWSHRDIEYFDRRIDHTADETYGYAAMSVYREKYLMQNRVTKKVYESPQIALMLMSMCFFQDYPKSTRKQYVIRFYNALKDMKLSLPTPIMGGLRSPMKQFSSCVLVEVGDSLSSINAANNAIVRYVSQRAGIGINGGRIRALGSAVRDGLAVHTGCLPFWRSFHAALKSCSQGALRGGAGTLFYPVWHKEVESFLVLKNNKGTEDNRIRHMDYGVQMNGWFLRKALEPESKMNLFCPNDVPDMYEAFFANQDEFERLYEKYSADTTIKKKTVKTMDILQTFVQERSSTGRVYPMFVDNVNNHGPFNPEKAPVRQSNLCVAPETKILTRDGYFPIAELEGEKIDIWNGSEWSEVDVVKTGENQKLIKVVTNAGYTIDCTEYHKFYIFDGYGRPYKEKRAHELLPGDKLCKFDLPVVDGNKTLDKAYANGFFTGDGCQHKGDKIVYLYHNKRKLSGYFSELNPRRYTVQEDQNREVFIIDDLKEKFFVPSDDYSVESKLKWLAGWLDADGCVYRNGSNEALVGSSTEFSFLQEVQMMLQTLGVSCKIMEAQEEGYRKMTANEGTGGYKEFLCRKSWRLLLSSYDSFRLLDLGLKFKRLEITKRRPQRDAKQFVTVAEVIDEGRFDDTFCFTEPKRHMGVFNGLLTGQCLEVALPTSPLEENKPEEGEIALCTLLAWNLGNITYDEFPEIAELSVRAIDALFDYQEYAVKAAEKAKLRRSIGIGVNNYAYWLAKQGLKYSGDEGNNATHELFENIQYHLLDASAELAGELGACEYFSDTRYSEGLLPIDWYKKTVDDLHTAELTCDWEALREKIKDYGLRNSTLTAIMPSETSSVILGATNGIEPPRGLVSSKSNKDGVFKLPVPEVQDLWDSYETCWQMEDNYGYLSKVAIMQKFVDQAISANEYHDPFKSGGKIAFKELVKIYLFMYKHGMKTAYYHNTRDMQGEDVDKEGDGCSGGGCKI